MKKTIITLLLLLSAFPLGAEFLFLKDGSIIKGKVITETGDAVTFRNEQNDIITYPSLKVLRVSYSELNPGKLFIQMKSGENFRAYLIEEENEFYRFRKIIDKPEEFLIEKEEVLFLAERSPAGLKGKSGYTDISLNWFHPYDKMKFYKIYIKKKKEEKYELASTSISNSYRIKGLSSKTRYFIKVTGVDDTGTETLPSNELEISTIIREPYPPSGLKVTHPKSGGTGIEWKHAVAPDTKIVKYKVYTLKNNKREIAGETNTTSINISGTAAMENIQITAVDNLGVESPALFAIMLPLTFTPGVIFPLGKTAEMFNIGFGGIFSFSGRNMFFFNFEAGVSLGCYYMQGKNLLDEKNKIFQDFIIAPVYFFGSYNIWLVKGLYLKPVLSAGGAYLDCTYKDALSAANPYKHLQIFEFAFKAGISAEYRFANSLSASVGCEYSAILQNTGLLHFLIINAGIGYSF
jgi:hypothetical protein